MIQQDLINERKSKRKTHRPARVEVSLRSSSTTLLLHRFRKATFSPNDIQKIVDQQILPQSLRTSGRLSEFGAFVDQTSYRTGTASAGQSNNLQGDSSRKSSQSSVLSSYVSSRATRSTLSSLGLLRSKVLLVPRISVHISVLPPAKASRRRVSGDNCRLPLEHLLAGVPDE